MKRKRPGFSAGEMVGVMAIIAIILSISIPSFTYLRTRYTLGGAAKLLAADLRYTQQLSVTQQAPHELRLFPAGRSYRIVRLGPPEVTLKNQRLDASIEIVDPTGLTDDRVSFNPAGAPSSNGDIILEMSSGYTATISVRPSGFIRTQ